MLQWYHSFFQGRGKECISPVGMNISKSSPVIPESVDPLPGGLAPGSPSQQRQELWAGGAEVLSENLDPQSNSLKFQSLEKIRN